MDGFRIGHQFVEHLRTVRQFLIVGTFLVEHADGRAVAPLGIGIALHVPVQSAELQQQHASFHAVAGGFLVALLIGADGLHGVLLQQVDVAHGVIDLVQVVLVVVVACHALQAAYHAAAVAGGHHLGLGNAGIELQLVGRVLAYHVLVGIEGLLRVAQRGLYLSHQEPFTGFLGLPLLVLDDFSQVG